MSSLSPPPLSCVPRCPRAVEPSKRACAGPCRDRASSAEASCLGRAVGARAPRPRRRQGGSVPAAAGRRPRSPSSPRILLASGHGARRSRRTRLVSGRRRRLCASLGSAVAARPHGAERLRRSIRCRKNGARVYFWAKTISSDWKIVQTVFVTLLNSLAVLREERSSRRTFFAKNLFERYPWHFLNTTLKKYPEVVLTSPAYSSSWSRQ